VTTEAEVVTEDRRSTVRPLTSVELLDAAVWREIGTEEPQPSSAFIEALSRLVGRWLLVRSETPAMDAVTLLCKARGYIERGGAEQIQGNGAAVSPKNGEVRRSRLAQERV
jgi:hypothetical protein